jgi:HK97 family phage prohead protease
MKNLNLVCEAKLSVNQGLNEATAPSGKIEAKVTTWGAREGADGRRFNYQPEGFADWAKEFADKGKPLPMFLNHNDMGMPIGEWHEFMFEDDGMSANGRLFMNTSGGRDIYNVLKESPNLFGGVSVGAFAEEYSWVDENGEPLADDADPMEAGYFQIKKGGLMEVSVVMHPNNEQASISALECIDQNGSLNPRNVEKLLREAGVSRKDATTASSIFKKILEQRDVAKKDLEVAPKQSESDAVVNEAEELLKALQLRELTKALEKRIK